MIQEAAAFCAVVNGGYYYQPHMVKQILNDQGGVVKTNDPILLRQPISASTSKVLQEALEMGVLYGTGRKAWVPGYRLRPMPIFSMIIGASFLSSADSLPFQSPELIITPEASV